MRWNLLLSVIDFVPHVDKYLEAFVQSYGVWVMRCCFW